MKPIMLILAGAAFALGFGTKSFSAQTSLNLAFSGSGSVFQGGPAAGFDYSASIGGDIGISFRARANSGTVSAHVNGVLRATFPATVPPNSPAAITLQYIGYGNGGSLASDLGASVNVDARVKFDTWLGDVNETVPLINEGFYLNPNKVFIPAISSTASGSDTDTALSFGPSIDIGVGDLGAYVNVNVQQTIQLTPTALNGTVWFTNQTTGVTRQLPFSITPGQTVNLTATNLATAFWDFAITGITLQNSFHNNVALVLHPYIDYVIDDWSPGDLSFGLIDQTFSLSFNTLQIPLAFTLEAQTAQAALTTALLDTGGQVVISSPTGIVHGVTSPNAWFAQSSVTHGTATAARSGITAPGQGSFMEATFDGPGVLSYWCKVSSTLNHDFLFVLVDGDGSIIPWLSGEVNWQQQSITISNSLPNEGTHKVRWYYGPSFYGSSGSNAAFVDQVVFTPAPLTFERALDSDKITSLTSPIQGNYTAAWFPQTNVTHDGADAMRSGAIADDKWSTLNGEITGPGRLSFWWKISAGVDDRLYFYFDGVDYLVPPLSGTSAWAQVSLDIPAGNHALGWLYDANYINTQPGGAGFVDEVVFTPYPFTYTNINGGITITAYTGSGGSVIIPDTIAGLPVTTIRSNTFLNKSAVTSVTLNTYVTSIGSSAFAGCTGLTGFTISSGVTNVASGAFDKCYNLAGITVDSLNPVYKSLNGVIFNRTLTTLLLCPGGKAGAYTVPDSVTSIGAFAFQRCTSLTNIILPYGVAGISGSAFANCSNVASVTIPSSVSSIGDSAFSLCPKLTGVYFQGDAPAPGVTMFNSSNSATNYYGLGAAGWSATYGGRPTAIWTPPPPYLYTTTNSTVTLTRYYGSGGAVSVPSTINGLPVISIGSSAFIKQASLTSVTIPSGITSIGDSAFSSCTSLTSVTIPNTVTNIGVSAFRSCTNLTAVTIPGGVTSIGDGAFSTCTRLASVTIPNTVTSLGNSVFQNCPRLTSLTIPGSVNSIGNGAFSSCASLTSVYFQGNAPSLGTNVFLNDTNLPPSAATIFYLPGAIGWGASLGGRPTALWQPQIQTRDAGFGLHTNQFGFTITWASGTTVFVEACTNLANPIWTPLMTNTLTDGSAYFSDGQTTNSPQKFYRVGSGRGRLTRWASSVLGYSSQYSASFWSAAQALGQPDTYPTYGDNITAWASLTPDASAEFLELGYDAPAPIDSVSIYETYAPGAVSKVSVRNPNTSLWQEVWSGTAAPAPAVARIFTVSFPQTSFPVGTIRIDLNSPAVPDWNEIDAVSISGVTP